MNETANAYIALNTIFFAFIFALLYFWGFRRQKVDVFRLQMFEVRDEMFDFAAQGGIDFQHPAYKLLRTTLNGYIRFSHAFSICLMFLAKVSESVKPFDAEWEEATRGLDENVLCRMNTFKSDMELVIIKRLFLSSPLKIGFFTILIIASEGIATIKLLTKRRGRYIIVKRNPVVSSSVQSFDNRALIIGKA